MTLAELFRDEDYQFNLHLKRGVPAEFFAPTAQHECLITERQHWLRTSPATYAALLPEGEALLEETIDFAQ